MKVFICETKLDKLEWVIKRVAFDKINDEWIEILNWPNFLDILT